MPGTINEIQHHYTSVLQREPLAAEITFWTYFPEDSFVMRLALTCCREFEAGLRQEFRKALNRDPSQCELEACRCLVVVGKSLENAAHELTERRIARNTSPPRSA